MPEFPRTQPHWIRDTGPIAVTLPPAPILQKFAGGQRGDVDANYELNFADAALDSLVRAGVTLVYARFFAGFGLEFEKGEIERLRDYYSRAHVRGIKTGAIVALGMLAPEALLTEESDAQNWLQFNGDGRTIAPDSALNIARPCYNSESFLRYLERVCSAAVDSGADLVYFDGAAYNVEPDTCRCPVCVGLFREFLRQQYGSHEEKTRGHGRERFGHNSFTHTRPPAYTAATVNTGEAIDAPHAQEWSKFKAHSLAGCVSRLSRMIGKRNPQCAVGADILFTAPSAEAAHGINVAALLPQLDMAGVARIAGVLDEAPIAAETAPPGRVTPAQCVAIRNFKVARAFGAACMESFKTAGDTVALEIHLALQLAFNNKGLGVAGEALSPWFGPGWEHRAEADTGLKLLRAYIDFYSRFKQPLLLDSRTLATLAVLRDPASVAFDAAGAAAQTDFEDVLIEHNIPFDIVYPQHLDDLSKYRGVVLAGCEALSDDIIRAIERFVAAGGGVLALGSSGRRDEWRRVRPQPGLGSLLGSEYPRALRRTSGSGGSGRAAYLPGIDDENATALIDTLEFSAGAPLPLKADCASGHAIVEGAATRSGAIAVHALNPHAAPAMGLRISVSCEQAPKQAIAHCPTDSDADAAVTWDNGRAHVQLAELARYVLLEIKF